jgi:hypothetical protein
VVKHDRSSLRPQRSVFEPRQQLLVDASNQAASCCVGQLVMTPAAAQHMGLESLLATCSFKYNRGGVDLSQLRLGA